MNYAKCDGRYIYKYNTLGEGGISYDQDFSETFTSSVFPSSIFIQNGKITLLTPTQITAEVFPDSSWNWDYASLGESSLVYLRDALGNNISVNNYEAEVTSQTYTIQYRFYYYTYTSGINREKEITLTYTFSAVKNQLPLKKWTITDVIVRACDLIESFIKFTCNSVVKYIYM